MKNNERYGGKVMKIVITGANGQLGKELQKIIRTGKMQKLEKYLKV